MSSAGGGVWRRLAVTLLVPMGAWWLGLITLPGVDVGPLEQLADVHFDRRLFGIFCVELRPILSAALLVEVLALLLPRWRGLRLGGYPERARLWRRVEIVGLVMVALQAFFIARWLQSTGRAYALMHVVSDGPGVLPLQIVTVVAGTFLLYWLARLVERFGAGNGLSVMIVGFLAAPTVEELVSSASKRLQAGERILLPLAVAAVAVAAVTRLAGGRPLRPQAAPPGRDELPMPSSSLQPIVTSAALVMLPAQLAQMGIRVPGAGAQGASWTQRGVQAALIAALCVLVAWMFNRPRVVADVWGRGAGEGAAPAADRVRAAFARSLAWSLAICWALAAADWLCADAGLAFSAVNVALIACVAADVVGELRFRHAHGALAPVWPVHRLYQLQGMLDALSAVGIPAFPRGRRHRTLGNYFAPFVPVDILVPLRDAERAAAILNQSLK